jgi:hypothetical protein
MPGYMADGEDLSRSAQLPSFSFGGFGAKSPASKSTPAATSVPKESLSPVPRQKEITSISIDKSTLSTSNSVATVTSVVTRVSTTATHTNDDELPDIVLDDGPDDSEDSDD